jgi:hypothetical protein
MRTIGWTPHSADLVPGSSMEIHQELPGRIHVVLIRRPAGF